MIRPAASDIYLPITSTPAATSAGPVEYADLGIGKPLVFLHGLVVNAQHWRKVARPLAADYRCIVPTLPLGAHRLPMRAEADLSPPGIAEQIADFLESLDLEDVVLVSNDTSTAFAQLLLTGPRNERISGAVITSGEAFRNFLPWQVRHLQAAARVPGSARLVAKALQSPWARRSSLLGFGLLTKHGIPDEVSAEFVRHLDADREIRRDLTKVLKGISSKHTVRAADQLPEFRRPVLLAWGENDPLFPLLHAEKLADLLPDAVLELVPNSRAYLAEDQPDRLADLIRAFVARRLT